MKKFLFVFVVTAFSLTSCSSDNNNLNSSYRINPPEWIQGEWLLDGATYGENGFRFSNDDLILIQPSLETSQKTLFKQSVDLGQNVTTDEVKTESSYNLKASFASGQTVTYGFTKISDTKISYDAAPNSIYIRQ
jgi:hypothetical protein